MQPPAMLDDDVVKEVHGELNALAGLRPIDTVHEDVDRSRKVHHRHDMTTKQALSDPSVLEEVLG